MIRKDFAVFILSYGRTECKTLSTLRKSGYTGKVYILIGDDDPCYNEYVKKYSNNLIVFNKDEAMRELDFDNYDGGRYAKLVLYARNYCFKIAKDLGLNYALMFDDDYRSIERRYIEENKLKVMKIDCFDEICNCFIEFLNDTGAITVAMSQGGDFIGGAESSMAKQKVKRKAMNAFFWNVNKPFQFKGSINEDVNMYLEQGRIGKLCLSVWDASVVQGATQQNRGGLTEAYLEKGTYVKSFYSVLSNPSCCQVNVMITDHQRIHHKINWNKACPKIVNEKYKK